MTHLRRILLAACAAMIAMAAAASEIPFGSRISIDDTYLGPVSVTSGDFDGDGLEDLVAAGIDGTALAWWRSLGDGTFSRYPVVATATDINDVEAADVNGDGRLDVVVTAGGSTDAVGWYENDGTPAAGGWPLRLIAYPFDGASGTAVGDVDGNGTQDVIGVAASAHVISVALNNNGTGIGWSYETVDPAFTGARWAAVGDIDGDGRSDVAGAAYISGEVSWWSRNGDGTWTEHGVATVANADVVELADMDRDGDLDLLGAGSLSFIRWWENDGGGGTWTEHEVGDPTTSVTAAYPYDLDLDGDRDVLYAAAGMDGLGWFENLDGDGTAWQMRAVDTGFGNALDVAAVDFDADGDPDLVGVDYLASEVAAWENLTIHRSAAFPFSRAMSSGAWSIRDLAPVDLDADGDLDVVYTDVSLEQIGWYENAVGDGSLWADVVVQDTIQAVAVAVADVNCDGTADIISGSDDDIYWWEGTTRHHVANSHVALDAVEAADFDGDGDIDLVAASNTDGIDWYENDACGTWTEHPIGAQYVRDADSLAVADVDGDGDPDLVTALYNDLRWTPNELDEPAAAFGTPITIADGFLVARALAVGDVDGDGDLDVVGADSNVGTLMWWANTAGDGSAWGAAQTIDPLYPEAIALTLVDLDSDGDLDVVVSADGSSTDDYWFGWFANQAGDGSSWSAEIFSEEYRRMAVATGDIDGDGDPDLVCGQSRFWPNRGGQAAVEVAATAPPVLDPLVLDDALEFDVVHLGRPGDTDAELATVDLELADDGGTPLSSAEADDALVGVYLFEDNDGSGDFDPGLDTQVAAVESFSLTAGVQGVGLTDGDSHARVPYGSPRRFFVVIAFESGAAASRPAGIEVAMRGSDAVVEDFDHDLPLRLELKDTVRSGVVVPSLSTEVFADDFEAGDLTAWSRMSP
jgi:hypothetical protein